MALASTSRLLKALGDETRLRILHLLRLGELSVSDLMEVLNLAQTRCQRAPEMEMFATTPVTNCFPLNRIAGMFTA